MKKIGYIRVSTLDQSVEAQMQELQKHGVEKFFEDKVSGKSMERPQLHAIMEYAREKDIVYVCALDRMARNLLDLRKIIDHFLKKDVEIIFLRENLRFSPGQVDAMSMLMLNLLGSFAEFERSLIKERQKEGIALAKAAGKYTGRKPCLNPQQIEDIRFHVSYGAPVAKMARKFHVSRAAVYKYLKD